MECGWGTALYWNYDTFGEEEAVVLYLGRKDIWGEGLACL
jgi:hypothetical protein